MSYAKVVEIEIKNIKNINWNNKLKDFKNTADKEFWNLVSKIKNRKINIPPIKADGTIYHSSQVKANLFATHFSEVLQNNFEPTQWDRDVSEQVQRLNLIPIDSMGSDIVFTPA